MLEKNWNISIVDSVIGKTPESIIKITRQKRKNEKKI
jgi:hypothetical protein